MTRAAAAMALLLFAGVAVARPARVVLTPVGAGGHDAAEAKLAAAVEGALVEGLHKLTTVELVNFEGGRLRGPGRVDAKADPRPQARGQALAKELGAEAAIVAEPQPLGDGAVVYLQVVEPGGKVRGSTTVAISADALKGGVVELERPLRGGVVQIIDAPHFVGRVELHIDAKGAEVDVDGRKPQTMTLGAVVTVELPVGTHAVRVTHQAYRDYLRFVDVAYDRTTVENVAMSAFPLTEGEMAEKRRHGAPLRNVPWYRSWWALSITGAVLVGATAGIVWAVRPGIESTAHTTYKAGPSF